MVVGLCVPVYKNFEGFAELMASVDIPVEPIIIDNWRENRGVSGGWNEGLEFAAMQGMDQLIISNDDVIFAPGTLRKLVQSLNEQPYDIITAYNTRDEDYSRTIPTFIDSPDYSCFALRPAQFLRKFGSFDENFAPAYFEDNDMHYRIQLLGGRDVKNTFAPMYHKGSVTQNWGGQTVVSSHMFEINRAYYAQKWGGVPGEESYKDPFSNPARSPREW